MANYMDGYFLGKRGRAKVNSKCAYALKSLLPKYSAECARLRREIMRVENGHDPLPAFDALKGSRELADMAIACGLQRDHYELRDSDYGKWLQRMGYYYSPCEA